MRMISFTDEELEMVRDMMAILAYSIPAANSYGDITEEDYANAGKYIDLLSKKILYVKKPCKPQPGDGNV